MRPEKKYLVEEVNTHLDKSDYVYLTNYERITVDEIADLRAKLEPFGAEFHVVKNSIFDVAAAAKELPDLSEHLKGQTAIVVGGADPSGVAKALSEFFKKKEKVDLKGGILDERELSRGTRSSRSRSYLASSLYGLNYWVCYRSLRLVLSALSTQFHKGWSTYSKPKFARRRVHNLFNCSFEH